jgi:hypothetical protein
MNNVFAIKLGTGFELEVTGLGVWIKLGSREWWLER